MPGKGWNLRQPTPAGQPEIRVIKRTLRWTIIVVQIREIYCRRRDRQTDTRNAEDNTDPFRGNPPATRMVNTNEKGYPPLFFISLWAGSVDRGTRYDDTFALSQIRIKEERLFAKRNATGFFLWRRKTRKAWRGRLTSDKFVERISSSPEWKRARGNR